MSRSTSRTMYRLRRWILAAAAVFAIGAALWGGGVFAKLSGGGLSHPEMEAARANDVITQEFGRVDADIILLYTDFSSSVDDPGFRERVEQELSRLPLDAVVDVQTFWSSGSESFVSHDRSTTYAAVQLEGDDEIERMAAFRQVAEELRASPPSIEERIGGSAAVGAEVNEQVGRDLVRAEAIALPVLLLLLVLILGSFITGLAPLALGVLAILGSFAILHGLTYFTEVTGYAVNMVIMLGLALSVDYALLITSRFRSELTRSGDIEASLIRTMSTAGRTVAFSGLTVAVSLAGLLFFPLPFLRSMAYGGIGVVLFAAVAALTVLPALLAILGLRVTRRRIWGRRRAPGESERGAWHAIARGVMRRPFLVLAAAIAFLIFLLSPFLHVSFGVTDARVLPDGTESRVVFEALEEEFPGTQTPIQVVVSGGEPEEYQPYVASLGDFPGVTGVLVAAVHDSGAVIAVEHDAEPFSPTARELVDQIRAAGGPAGADVLVGGQTAFLVDLLESMRDGLTRMVPFIVIVTLLLLTLAFRSLVLPLKAVVVNTLSLVAAFGVVVWIFQDGHLAELLGFTPTGHLDATQPVLMLAVAFGISMDYEVFLLSRVREEWDRTHDNVTAVAVGLQRTGWVITTAALLILVVFGAFATSGIAVVKLIGVGLFVALLVDATVVRVLLVPAAMRIMGRANWWIPARLARSWTRPARLAHRETIG